MRLAQKVSDSIVFSTAVLVVSILVPIIPCRVAPAVPNPSFSWTFCTLNPDVIAPGSVREFFGYTASMADAMFITLLLAFVLSFTVFHYLTKRKRGERR